MKKHMKPPKRRLGLERSTLEAYAGLSLSIWIAVVPMTWWLRCLLLAILAAIILHVCWRHPWTEGWQRGRKATLFTFTFILVAAPAVRPIIDDYKRGTIDQEPKLTFSITPGRTIVLDNRRAKSDLAGVRIQGVEYRMGGPDNNKVLTRTTIGGDLEYSPFTVKAATTKDLNLNTAEYRIMEIRDFVPTQDLMESWSHFYCMRFTFTNAGTGTKYVHYMIVSPFRNGPDVPEHPENFSSNTSGNLEVYPFDMLHTIKADCRSVWGNELPEYLP